MTSTFNQKHLCFTLEVIRGYSFVYTKDNHKVCITAFNLRGKKRKEHTTSKAQRQQYVTNAGFLLFYVLYPW